MWSPARRTCRCSRPGPEPAEDGSQAVPQGCGELRAHLRVVLGVVLPPFAVPDEGVLAAESCEERTGDVSGVRARVVL